MLENRTALDKFISGGKGSESFGTKAKFVARFLSLAIGWGLFVSVAVVASWFLSISPTSKSLLANEFRAESLSPTQSVNWMVRCRFSDWPQGQCGDSAVPSEFKETVIVSKGVSKLTADQYRAVVDQHFMTDRLLHPATVFWLVVFIAVGAGVTVSTFAFKRLLKTGQDMGKNKRLSGALDLVSGAELSEIVKNSGTGSAFEICEVTLPKQTLVKGVVFAGSQGSGKSTALHDLISQVKTHNRKVGENA
jgi:hypothetical protein